MANRAAEKSASRRRNQMNPTAPASRQARWRRLFPGVLPFDAWRTSRAVERLVSWFKSPVTGGRSYATATPLGRWSQLNGVEGLEARYLLATDIFIDDFGGATMNITSSFDVGSNTVTFESDGGGTGQLDVDDVEFHLNLGRNVIVGINTADNSEDGNIVVNAPINKTNGGDAFLILNTEEVGTGNANGNGEDISVNDDISTTSGQLEIRLIVQNDLLLHDAIMNTNGDDFIADVDENIALTGNTSVTTAGGTIDFLADNDIAGVGTIQLGPFVAVDSGNADILFQVGDDNGSDGADIQGTVDAGTADIAFQLTDATPAGESIGLGSGTAAVDLVLDETELQKLNSSGTLTIGSNGRNHALSFGDADLSSATGTGETYDLVIFGDNGAGGSEVEFHGVFITGDNIRMEVLHTGGDVQDEDDTNADEPNLVIPGDMGELLIEAANVGTTGGENVLDISVAKLDVNATGASGVDVDNTGAVELVDLNGSGDLTSGALFEIDAESPLTVSSPIIATGEVDLHANDGAGSDDHLTVDADITSTTSNILLRAGEDIRVASGVTISALSGGIRFEGDNNGLADTTGSNILIDGVTFETARPIRMFGNDATDTFTIRNVTLGTPAVNVGASLLINGNGDVDNGLGDQVTIENVQISDALPGAGNGDGDGLVITDVDESVDISDSSFNENTGDGIQMTNVGDVTLTNVTASSNDPGVFVSGAASFTDIGGTYELNDSGGIVLEDIAGDLALDGTTLRDNDADGVGGGDGLRATENNTAFAIGGNVTITGAEVHGNATATPAPQVNGIVIDDASNNISVITIDNTNVSGHEDDGALIIRGLSATVTNSTFVNNGTGSNDDGIHLQGINRVDMDNVQALDNAHHGVRIVNANGGPGVMGVGLVDVVATGNLTGAYIQNANSVSDTSGIYSDNDDGGLVIAEPENDVNLDGTTADNNDADGNDDGDGINITDSNASGPVILSNVTANNNDPGVRIVGVASVSDLGGTYTGNKDHGIFLEDITGNVTLTNTTANDNDANNDFVGSGLHINDGDGNFLGIGGTLTIDGGSFQDTDGAGTGAFQEFGVYGEQVTAQVGGDLIISNGATFSGNAEAGLVIPFIIGDPGGANGVQVTDASFDNNGHAGLGFSEGFKTLDSPNVSFTNSTASNNGTGVVLGGGFTGTLTTDSLSADNNASEGLVVLGGPAGTISLTNGTFDGNGGEGGIFIDTAGNVTIAGSSASDNTDDGIDFRDVGDVSLTNVTADSNDDDGFDVDPAGAASLTIMGGSYSDNDESGIGIAPGSIPGNVVIDGATVDGNADVGLTLDSLIASVQNSSFNNNTVGILVEDTSGASIVDLGGGDNGSSMNPGSSLPVSAGNNDFTSYTSAATPTSGAIVNLTDNPPNDNPGSQGFPHDVAAVGNDFAAHPEMVIYHDFDDTGIGLVEYGELEILELKLNGQTGPVTIMVDEGDIVTLEGTFQSIVPEHVVTIDWGDGFGDSFTLNNFDDAFTIDHQYLDDNPSVSSQDTYTVKVTIEEVPVNDPPDMVMDSSNMVTVKNVPPAFTSLDLSATTGMVGDTVSVTGQFNGQATFHDPGILDTFEFLIDTDNDGTFDITMPVSGGVIPVTDFTVTEPTNAFVFRITDDDSGIGEMVVPVSFTPGPITAHLFYNNSSFDGNNPGADANDANAIAPDKFPFFPGQTANFGNISSYDKGINGVILNVPGLPGDGDRGAAGALPMTNGDELLEVNDFNILVGTNNDINTWAAGPTPQVSVLPNAGPGASDQIKLIFPDNSIEDEYVAIQMLANADTGLAQTMTFLFGSVVGETGESAVPPPFAFFGRDSGDFASVASDITPLALVGTEPITNVNDINRDGTVGAQDLTLIAAAGINPAAVPVATPDSGAPGAATLAVDEAVADDSESALADDSTGRSRPEDGRVGGDEEEDRDLAFATFGSGDDNLLDDGALDVLAGDHLAL